MPDAKTGTAEENKVAQPAADPAATPAPQFVSMAELKASEERTAQRLEGVTQSLANVAAALASNRAPAQAAPAPQRTAAPTDQELVEGMQNGDPRALKRLLQAERETLLEAIGNKIASIEHTGTTSISALTERVMRAEMPHYNLLKNDIEKKLAMVAPELRMQPEALANVYHIVVGENIDKIVTAAVEAKLREARGNPDGNADGRGTERERADATADAAQLKEFEAEVGTDAMQALRSRGQTPQQFVNRLGYKDIESYLKTVRPEGGAQ